MMELKLKTFALIVVVALPMVAAHFAMSAAVGQIATPAHARIVGKKEANRCAFMSADRQRVVIVNLETGDITTTPTNHPTTYNANDSPEALVSRILEQKLYECEKGNTR
jgi:hypothetical protein